MILEAFAQVRSWAFQNRHPSESGAWFDESESSTGLVVTEISALSNTAVYQAVQLIAGMMATIPLITYRRNADGNPERAQDHPLYRLLRHEPNPETTAFAFHQARLLNKLTGGNAYAEIERGPTGAPVALWQIPSWLVTPHRVYKRNGGGITTSLQAATPEDRSRGGEIWYEVNVGDAKPVWIPSRDMLHTPGLSFNGLKGFSPVRVAMESIAVGLAMQKSAAAVFGNASEPGGVIERPKEMAGMTPAGERVLLATFEQNHRGVGKRGRVALLQEGMTYKTVQTSLRELQFAESIKHNIPEVARIFNLPSYFLGHDGSQNTYSNVEGEWIRLTRQTLMPHAAADEQEIYRKLVSEAEADTVFAEFELKSLLKGDSAARASYLQTMIDLGVMTPGEAARLENLPPVPDEQGGNKYRQKDAAPKPPAAPPAASLTTAKADDGEGDAADDDRATRLAARLESALRATLQRVVTREVRELRRQIERPDASTASLIGWLDGFYQRELPDFLAELAAPAVGDARANALAWEWAARHRAELRGEIATGNPAAVLGRIDTWTETEATIVARAETARLAAAEEAA